MKSKVYFKNLIRIIFNTKARFLSIFCIVFLGAAFFSGLRQAPLIMQESMDHYYRQYQWADLNYIGTLGYQKDIIADIQALDDVDSVDYGLRFDAYMNYQDQTLKPVTVYTSEDFQQGLNLPEVVEGKLPKNDQQCLLDYRYASMHNLTLDDKITLQTDYGTKEFDIVGLINDTRYTCNFDRGTNTLGDGSSEAFVCLLTKGNESLALPQELYDLHDGQAVYNDLYIKLKGSEDYRIFDEDYVDYIQPIHQKIETMLEDEYLDFHQDIISDGQSEIDEGYTSYQEGMRQYLDGLAQLNQAKEEYESGLTQYLDGQKQYQQGMKDYLAGQQLYNQGVIDLQQGKQDYQQGYQEYLSYVDQLNQYDQGLTALESQFGSLEQLNELIGQLEMLPTLNEQQQRQLVTLKEAQGTYQSLLSVQDEMNALRQSLPGAKEKLDQSFKDISDNENLLNENKADLDKAKATLDNSLVILQQTKQQLDQAKNQLDQSETLLNETKQQLDDAKASLDQASLDLQSVEEGQVIGLTKEESSAILTYDANCGSIESLSILFPTIFFLVAALVSLTTMTRMVEEQRVQSGTLRALGFLKRDVIFQYLAYAFLATFFACGLGIVFGTYFFPMIIYYLYRIMMFSVGANVQVIFDSWICIQTFLISVAITMAVTYIVCAQELNETPAQILRPKAPKNGKRIVLERISWLWSHLSFNQKVTMRNIFRYKKRFFMSVAGIAGCSALMVVGFGLKQSIAPLASEQYGTMWTYDGIVSYGDEATLQTRQDFENQAMIQDTLNVYDKTVAVKNQYAILEIPEDNQKFGDFVCMKDSDDQLLELDDQGVMINQKLSELIDVKVGDMMTIELDNHDYQVKVQGIYQLYFNHYIYMSRDYYQQLVGQDIEYHSQYYILKDDSSSSQNKLAKYVDDHRDIASAQSVSGISESFVNQMDSINSVVIILIVCAGALAFIVLYNLTNINIQERKSEIATIKVLGFYPKEVYDYVFRENIILSFIGGVVGLGLGNLIHGYLIRTVEVDQAMFIRSVHYSSYFYALILTMIFTFFIDLVMRKVLKNIDMVESLKSIE